MSLSSCRRRREKFAGIISGFEVEATSASETLGQAEIDLGQMWSRAPIPNSSSGQASYLSPDNALEKRRFEKNGDHLWYRVKWIWSTGNRP